MADRLLPLVHSHDATALEAEMKDLFIKLYADAMAATADDINVYGAPHLGSFSLVERNIDMDGLTVLRETTEDRIRYLFRAWRHRNPERGMHFLRLYLAAIFGDRNQVTQLWQKKDAPYPEDLRTEAEITDAGLAVSQFFLTSRVRVDVDTEVVPAKLLASLKSAVAARILLNVRVSRVVTSSVGVAMVTYAGNVMRKNRVGEYDLPPQPDMWLVTEDGIQVVSEGDHRKFRPERYPVVVPQAGGVVWQTLLSNVALRRQWDTLGVRRVLLQWIAVDGVSFIDNPWLPTYNVKLNLNEFVQNAWAEQVIVGLPGYFNETTARNSLAQMGDWAEKFGTLSYPSRVAGFYFPVEIDPTWQTAKQDLAPIWDKLPRPLYISAYYGNGIDGEAAAQWLADLLPQDVILMFQDGVGAFDFSLELARSRIRQLENHLGAHRVHVIAEAFRYNGGWDGTPGEYFLPLEPGEYAERINAYSDLNAARRLWVFDAPNYMSSKLIQQLNGAIPVMTPENLGATRSSTGDIRMTWDRTSVKPAHVTGYTVRIYDTAGNNVIRTIETTGTDPEAFYTAADSTIDFGFPPTFLVFDVAEKSERFISDFAPAWIGDVKAGVWLNHAIGLVGGGYMGNFFADYTDTANPGTTGAEGGAFTVAAYKLRQSVAAGAGISVSQVATFNMAIPGSYLTKVAADLMGSDDYWWDSATENAGPALIDAISKLDADTRLTSMVWGGSNDQNAVIEHPDSLADIAAAFTPCLLGVIRTIRNSRAYYPTGFKLWVHPYLRAFFGDPAQEANGTVYATLRKAQLDVVRSNQPLYRIGTWGPGCEVASGYWNENGSRINPLPATAHAAAAEIGDAIARDYSRLTTAPSWATMNVITDGEGRWLGDDVQVTWKPVASSTGKFRVRNLRADTLAQISSTVQAGNTFTFTAAQQVAVYGYTVTNVVMEVQEFDEATGVGGAPTRIEQDRASSAFITDIAAERSTWGDVVVRWKNSTDLTGVKSYRVHLFNPGSTTAMRVIDVAGADAFRDGQFHCDYPNELNVPDAVTARGDQFHWQNLGVAIEVVTDSYLSSMVNITVPLDNNAFVSKIVACGINSLVGGYFNDLSDPLNPGGTGREGRRDKVAAATFRHAMAQAMGLRDVQVMPVMVVTGSSPINPMPYQAGFDLNNYWWNPTTNAPGPNLLSANAIITGLGRAPDYFIECGPGETTGISYAPEAQRAGILAAWRTSNIAMLAWMRANWGNPSLQVWFQGASTSWWGDPPPQETNWVGAKLLRDLQTSMALENIGFKVGSYIPEGNKYTTFLNEMAAGMGWVHYTVAGYHAAASEMGQAMGSNTNRALDPPAWTKAEMPAALKGVKMANGDVKMSWTGPAGQYKVRVYNPGNGAVLRTVTVSDTQFIYTAAQQTEDFGNGAVYVQISVAQLIDGTSDEGPAATFTGSVLGNLMAPTGLNTVKSANDDMVMSWNARAGVTHYYLRNFSASDGSVLTTASVEGTSYTFTRAAQVAAYGFDAGFASFQLYEMDVATSGVGEMASWSGNAERASSPTNGSAAHTGGTSDVKMTWDKLDATSWIIEHYNLNTGNVGLSRTVTQPTDTFTTAEQQAMYGFTAGFVQWRVTAIKANGAASVPVTFSGGV